jgi:S-adenosylmethionine hydrolase
MAAKHSAVPDPIITLTTDFGDASPYVAAMKGVVLGVNPLVRLVDLTHAIPPQDVRYTDYFLASALSYYPHGTLHVVVVDPGVGSERAILYAEVAGQRVLAPDNGCLTSLFANLGPSNVVRHVREPRFWRPSISSTFHGRDIFAPVAGYLSTGIDPALLGPLFTGWVTLDLPPPRKIAHGIEGEVAFVDPFGNLISNIPSRMIRRKPSVLRIGRRSLGRFAWVRSYAEAKSGQIAALISSDDRLEVAVVNGNAARRLHASVGTPLAVGFAR